jgi:hypothetical protein
MIQACAGQAVELRHRTIEVVEAADRANRVYVIGVAIGWQRELFAVLSRETIDV